MVQAYILVSVEPGKNQKVLDAMRSVQGVKQVHACWGQPDIFSFVEVAASRAYSRHLWRGQVPPRGSPWPPSAGARTPVDGSESPCSHPDREGPWDSASVSSTSPREQRLGLPRKTPYVIRSGRWVVPFRWSATSGTCTWGPLLEAS